jgi:hypothetical protein
MASTSSWALLAQVALGQADDFGGNAFALQILHRFHRRIFRHAEDPPRWLAADFAEDEFSHLVNLRVVLDDPIMAGNPGIKVAVLHVTADFLRADEADLQFLIIHIRDVGALAHLDVKAGLGHLFNRGLLQAALGQAQFQNAFLHVRQTAR